MWIPCGGSGAQGMLRLISLCLFFDVVAAAAQHVGRDKAHQDPDTENDADGLVGIIANPAVCASGSGERLFSECSHSCFEKVLAVPNNGFQVFHKFLHVNFLSVSCSGFHMQKNDSARGERYGVYTCHIWISKTC